MGSGEWFIRVRIPTPHNNIKIMVREISIDENYKTVRLFDEMKKGDIYKVPYDEKRHLGIRLEATRRNKEARLLGIIKSRLDIRYRVSSKEYPGYTAIICLK